MDQATKWKQWVNENVPMLSNLYDNKYIGMVSDRFASLPPKTQKKVVIAIMAGAVFIVFLYLFLSYLSLWSASSKSKEAYTMANLLQQYQKTRRDKSDQIRFLARNSQLAAPGQLKNYLTEIGRSAGISNKMMKIEEKGEVGTDDGKGPKSDVKIKQATVSLEKVTIIQVTAYLKSIEFGQYNLQVSSVKIQNDEKLRGYMTLELGVVAHLFETEEG